MCVKLNPRKNYKNSLTSLIGKFLNYIIKYEWKNSTVKRGNFDGRGNFDWSGSFVKGSTVQIQKSPFVASAFMEINHWCSGLRIYMLLRSCLQCSNLKTICKFGISRKNWPIFKTVLIYWIVPYWYLFLSYQGKRISYWFRIVSLDILILKKQQVFKLQKIGQSYPLRAIKVTPKSQSKLLILNKWT